MGQLFGLYLLVTLGCTYYVIHRHLSKEWTPKGESVSYSKVVWGERKAKVAAFLIIILLWWVQDVYRHKLSPEAEALKQFDNLLDKWQIGKKSEVIREIDQLSNSERPWEYQNASQDD